jgi:hypothetical protein
MAMNRTVVRKMIKRLESVPEHYDQKAYYVERDDKAPCGTVACLAGEAVICSAKTIQEGINLAFAKYDSIPERAEVILGLPRLQHSVFAADGSGWPEPYRTQFAQSQKADQSKIAAAYLKEALKRGTMIW